ncbi:MAG: hypothetical protein ACJ77K_06605 [Bacteroidia bacterium]
MLVPYDHLALLLDEYREQQRQSENRFRYFVNDVFDLLGISSEEERNASLERTLHACETLHIPVAGNFLRIYRFGDHAMVADWKLSPLACYLVIINCDPVNEKVAKAQLFLAGMHL